MHSKLFRLGCVILTVVMLCNMLPLQAFAEEAKKPAGNTVTESATEDAHVVEEVKDRRTEFTKQFKLSNGLHLAAVYAEPVHYEKDGQWQEIDNTLKTAGSGANARYTNTAGLWDVSFPQQLSGKNAVSIEKDGYTLSFYMSGELRLSANESVMSASKQTETFAVSPMKQSSAQVEKIDLSKAKAEAQYPETVYERGHSRVRYDNVYTNTNIVYDLQGNRVKESVVMGKYDDTLRGYRYTLNAEDLTPVLEEDGQILLYAKGTKDVVMVMPAPYLIDAAGESSYDVKVTLTPDGSNYTLSYLLPQKWLAEETRQWPVVLDPVVQASLVADNIQDRTISQIGQRDTRTDGSIECGYTPDYGMLRIFMRYVELPTLSSADVIVGASLSMLKCMTSNGDRLVTVHKLNNDWDYKTITWNSYFGSDIHANYDHNVTDYQVVRTEARYYWDITDIARSWYEDGNTGMLFRMVNEEELSTHTIAQFWSVDYTVNNNYKPILQIEFRNNNGLESYWDYTASSAGRAGTGYINNYTGNLVWVRGDIGFGGNRMPVSINHVYNANDADENNFGLGHGWRTNFNQRVKPWTEDGYYVWEDSDGTYHYFLYDESSGKYKDEDGLDLTLEVSDDERTITDKYGNVSCFDSSGRLTKQENNQATRSSIQISYEEDSDRIFQIIDGAGRKYNFTYGSFANVEGKLLTKIGYTGTGSNEVSYVSFGYTGSLLTSVTDKDGETSIYGYTTNNLLSTVTDIDGYALSYDYNVIAAGRPARVASVNETHNGVSGGSLSIEYAHNQTTFTDVSGNVQIMQFNNWGNTVSIQDGEGRAQYAKYATDTSSTAKGNQLSLASKLQNTVGNRVKNSSFEYDGVPVGGAMGTYGPTTAEAYHGSRSFFLTSDTPGCSASPCDAITVYPGETYTFSAYVKTGTASGQIDIYNGSSYTSDNAILPAGTDWTRLEVSYTNTSSNTEQIRAAVVIRTPGTLYVDCIQVEKAPTASRYNLIENGDFLHTDSWSSSAGRTTLTAAATELDTTVYKMTGNPSATNRISQTVKVSGNKDDCFVLAGWAKGDSAPLRDNREFSVIATFLNSSGSSVGTSKVTFNPDNNSSVAWQYAAAAIIAPAAYSSIKIELAYDYNVNTVYFDGIQLYKEEFGTSYTYDADGNVTSVKDLQKQTTTYEYTNNNLTKQTLPTGAALTYTYDNYHNVLTAKSATGVNYNFAYDTYGNNTSVSIVSGSVKLTSSASYTTDGNRMETTTDALGKVTTYSYNADTNVLDWIQYPEDTTATKTEYTYDSMYRLSRTEADVSTGSTLFASYGYTNDLLTSITTGSTTYSFAYGNFALRSNIKIGSRTLASYAYTSRTNYLSSLDYGNGDSVDYTYDQQGRVTKQTYEDGDTVTYKYDNNGALASVTDSATGITTTYYYDFTDRLMKHVENGSGYSHSVGYEYDNINNLTALVETINGVAHTTAYTYDKDNRVSSITNGSASETYTYDTYSRVDKKITSENGTPILTDTFKYREPTTTTTAGQIEKLITDASEYDVTYTYTYDDNGNILSVSTGSNNTTSYVYDSANQLTRENNQAAGKTWAWTYDDAGNITSRNEYAYTTGSLGSVLSTVNYSYGDSSWGDLLTGWNGKTITSDTIGNMTSDGIWSYTWEHGRELASMSGGGTTWNFTYNADGLRTNRTNGPTTYSYVYNGSSLSQMTVGGNTLYFAYDASGTPLSVTYNGTNYYYATNLQSDVTAILNTSGTAVVQYTYDAWGKLLTTTGSMASDLGVHNPLRYRGYVYDTETGLYYLQSRYYNPEMGRFINADEDAATGNGLLGNNMFAYCGNNPVNRTDITGKDWWHWAVAAAIVVAAAVAVVATAGGAAAAITAVTCVANGVAAGSTATTVAAGVFIGSSTALAVSAYSAALESNSAEEFANHGESALYTTAGSGIFYGMVALGMSQAQKPQCPSKCFVAGTEILTKDGQKPIENIKIGDKVWSWDEETGDVDLKEVVELYRSETTELVHVLIKGEEIISTPTHPFYSPVKGWTDAVHLRAGDILVLVNGEYVVVEKVQHEILEEPITVYNFQVEDYHTYYVTDIGILVHNSCHGNSLQSKKTNYGYQLQDENGNIVKYGETLYPNTRYSQKWLDQRGYTMRIMISGTKTEVHLWQHQKILDYTFIAGHRPPGNRSFW